MKKNLALALSIMMLTFAAAAMADAVKLGSTDFSVTFPVEMFEAELEAADTEEGMVAAYLTEDESLEMDVYVAEAEGTLADIEAEFKEEMPNAEIGYTTINGIQLLYVAYSEEGENCIGYFIIDGTNDISIEFLFTTEAAGQISSQIMNTLTK